MPRTTPFHARLEPLNQTGIWKHWSGYLVAPQYQYSLNTEYYAIRSGAGLLDTSPLFKYRITGPGARPMLERALARDVGKCAVGRAQYTCWCDDRGFVLQDGVVLHVSEEEYLLTAAEPALRWLRTAAREAGIADVVVDDVSDAFGILALQGPHAHEVLRQLTDAATPLRYFGLTTTEIEGREVIVSRTGYTGDLGYEVWIRSEDAHVVWDAIVAAGRGHGLTPMGTTALKMARVEAGLLLMGADFHNARFTWVDAERETPIELGWSWMFRKLDEDGRDFVGRAAIEAELKGGTSRWKTVGLAVDWEDYERVYAEAGILAPHHELYAETTMSVYRRGGKEWDYAGYASSFLASTLLRRPIAIAKLPLDLAEPGSEVDLEVQVIRQPKTVLSRVARLPFYDPPRKTAPVEAPVAAEVGR
jgi:aminomethyltransferase